MRYAVLCLPFMLAAAGSGEDTVSACGDAALAAAPDHWEAANAVTGDLTQDGKQDVVFWRSDSAGVSLYIVACDGNQPVETWRFRVPVDEHCPPAVPLIEMTGVLLDASLIDRVCAAGRSDECQHMRRENERRQMLTDGGARQLRVKVGACAETRFRWSKDGRGFARYGA